MESQVANGGGGGLEGIYQWRSGSTSFIHRTRESLWEKSAQIHKALRQASFELVVWMQKGGPWRTFLVSTVAIVLLLGFAGLGTFMLFFLAVTLNAVAVGFLASIASVGAFTALFFSSLTAIYIGALVMAVFVISTITFFCICAALTAAGWIAFLWVVWQGLKKGTDLLKGFLGVSVPKLAAVPMSDEKYFEQQNEKPY